MRTIIAALAGLIAFSGAAHAYAPAMTCQEWGSFAHAYVEQHAAGQPRSYAEQGIDRFNWDPSDKRVLREMANIVWSSATSIMGAEVLLKVAPACRSEVLKEVQAPTPKQGEPFILPCDIFAKAAYADAQARDRGEPIEPILHALRRDGAGSPMQSALTNLAHEVWGHPMIPAHVVAQSAMDYCMRGALAQAGIGR